MFYGEWWRSLISEASADLLRIKLLCRMVINALLSLTAVGPSSLRGSVPEAGQSREQSLNQEALPLIWISWNRQTLRLIGKSCNYLWNNPVQLVPLFNLSPLINWSLWWTGPFDELVPQNNTWHRCSYLGKILDKHCNALNMNSEDLFVIQYYSILCHLYLLTIAPIKVVSNMSMVCLKILQ